MDKVKQEEIEKSDETQQPNLNSNSEMTMLPASEMSSMRQEVHAKQWVLYNYSNVKLVYSNSSSGSRFEGMELLRQSAYCINWMISSQKVSPDKDNVCYLVFKLSENCRGLHCPVIVRNRYRWKSKETIYFRYPDPWNVHETDRVPKERNDGWMEVIVWIYNSSNYKLCNDSLHVNLKLISYEGTMSGLIIRGLEFRPMEE
ncbi:F-box protein At2g02240-like [Rutidosis leptorrhynchoides]|uniref:F-box protein At2g02240-like n=1 Tax=Rutidosis leptorrhynchoides TaxID=125765 RepID=UPI003A999F30